MLITLIIFTNRKKSIISYSELRHCEPKEEDNLEGIPEWEPIQDKINKVFDSLNKSKNSPVCQPLGIVSCAWAFNGLERSIGYDR
jgi:hypothetical protein